MAVQKRLLQIQRRTSLEWLAFPRALKLGEPGYNPDTKEFKIGDGSNTWEDLPLAHAQSWGYNLAATPLTGGTLSEAPTGRFIEGQPEYEMFFEGTITNFPTPFRSKIYTVALPAAFKSSPGIRGRSVSIDLGRSWFWWLIGGTNNIASTKMPLIYGNTNPGSVADAVYQYQFTPLLGYGTLTQTAADNYDWDNPPMPVNFQFHQYAGANWGKGATIGATAHFRIYLLYTRTTPAAPPLPPAAEEYDVVNFDGRFDLDE